MTQSSDIADRLHLARLGEPAVLDQLADELHGLAALEAGGVLLAQAVRTYHRRRLAEAGVEVFWSRFRG